MGLIALGHRKRLVVGNLEVAGIEDHTEDDGGGVLRELRVRDSPLPLRGIPPHGGGQRGGLRVQAMHTRDIRGKPRGGQVEGSILSACDGGDTAAKIDEAQRFGRRRGRMEGPFARKVWLRADDGGVVVGGGVDRGRGPEGDGLRAVGVFVEVGADAGGRLHRAQEAGVADFARDGREGCVCGLRGAVAPDEPPVLAAAALVVCRENEGELPLHALHLHGNRGFWKELRNHQLLFGGVGLHPLADAVVRRRTLEVGTYFRDPDRLVLGSDTPQRLANRAHEGGVVRR